MYAWPSARKASSSASEICRVLPETPANVRARYASLILFDSFQ